MAMGLPNDWVLASGIMSLLLIWLHKENIRNLLAGKEAQIGKRDAVSTAEGKTTPSDNRSA